MMSFYRNITLARFLKYKSTPLHVELYNQSNNHDEICPHNWTLIALEVGRSTYSF